MENQQRKPKTGRRIPRRIRSRSWWAQANKINNPRDGMLFEVFGLRFGEPLDAEQSWLIKAGTSDEMGEHIARLIDDGFVITRTTLIDVGAMAKEALVYSRPTVVMKPPLMRRVGNMSEMVERLIYEAVREREAEK